MIDTIIKEYDQIFMALSGSAVAENPGLVWDGSSLEFSSEEPERFKETILHLHDFLVLRYGGVLGMLSEFDSLFSSLPYVPEEDIPYKVFMSIYFGRHFRDGNKRTALVVLLGMLMSLGKPLPKIDAACLRCFGDEVFPEVPHLTKTRKEDRMAFVKKIFS